MDLHTLSTRIRPAPMIKLALARLCGETRRSCAMEAQNFCQSVGPYRFEGENHKFQCNARSLQSQVHALDGNIWKGGRLGLGLVETI